MTKRLARNDGKPKAKQFERQEKILAIYDKNLTAQEMADLAGTTRKYLLWFLRSHELSYKAVGNKAKIVKFMEVHSEMTLGQMRKTLEEQGIKLRGTSYLYDLARELEIPYQRVWRKRHNERLQEIQLRQHANTARQSKRAEHQRL